MYVNPDTMNDIANIMDDFELDTLKDVFRSQIITDEELSIKIDHLSPLDDLYKRARDTEHKEEDDFAYIRSNYRAICMYIISLITTKYDLGYDEEWVNDHIEQLPAFTKVLYHFFVLDVYPIILELLNNYIAIHSDELYDAFKEYTQDNTLSNWVNSKILDEKWAVIVSNIYDVTDYAFSVIDNDNVFDYLNKKYLPTKILNNMIETDIINGDFVHEFADIYKEQLNFRSAIAFDLVYKIKEIHYLYNEEIVTLVNNENIKEESPEILRNKSIDDDVDEV